MIGSLRIVWWILCNWKVLVNVNFLLVWDFGICDWLIKKEILSFLRWWCMYYLRFFLGIVVICFKFGYCGEGLLVSSFWMFGVVKIFLIIFFCSLLLFGIFKYWLDWKIFLGCFVVCRIEIFSFVIFLENDECMKFFCVEVICWCSFVINVVGNLDYFFFWKGDFFLRFCWVNGFVLVS